VSAESGIDAQRAALLQAQQLLQQQSQQRGQSGLLVDGATLDWRSSGLSLDSAGPTFASGSAQQSAFVQNQQWKLGPGGQIEANLAWVGPNGEAGFVMPYARPAVDSNVFGMFKDAALTGFGELGVWGDRQGGGLGWVAYGLGAVGYTVATGLPGSQAEIGYQLLGAEAGGVVLKPVVGTLNKLPVLGADVVQASQAGLRWLGAGIDGAAESYMHRLGGLSYVVPEDGPVTNARLANIGHTAGAAHELPISNAVLGESRIGWGQKGQGSGNKIDQLPSWPVLDEVQANISVRPWQTNSPVAVQEFPGAPLAHGFPNIVDNYAGVANTFGLRNGATLYQVEGSLNGVGGRFEWIVDPNMGGVTHRMFVPGGTVNGIPVKP
jgi:hypothetical protein